MSLVIIKQTKMPIPKKVLEELGLSEREAKVYLSSLELGPSPVQKIASKAGINRTTAYFNLESLLKRGLVSTIKKGVKDYFIAESPEQLELLLSKQEQDMRAKKEALSEIIPELKNLFSYAGERPVVRFYEGVEGLKAIQEDYLRSSKKKDIVYGFISLDYLFDIFPSQEKDYTSRRIQKGITSKIIYTRKAGPLTGATKKEVLREARFIPMDKFPFTCGINIYGKNKMAIVSYTGKLVGVIIESSEIAKTFKAIFDLSWEAAEKYNYKKT